MAAQIARGLNIAIAQASRSGIATTTIRLNPGTLGQLRIRVRLDGDALHARFETFNPQARGLLATPISELRGRLAERGFLLARFEIVDAAPPPAAQTIAPKPDPRPEDAGGPATSNHPGSSEHDPPMHGLSSSGDTPAEPRRPRDERPPTLVHPGAHRADPRSTDEPHAEQALIPARHYRSDAARILDTFA